MNYYQVLEVSQNSSDSDIKKSYKQLAKKYHPDNTETGNSEKMTQINEAFDVLKDPTKRQQYDLSLKMGYTAEMNFNGYKGFDPRAAAYQRDMQMDPEIEEKIRENLRTIYEQFGKDSNFKSSRTPKNKHIEINYGISLTQAYTGIKEEISIPLPGGNIKKVTIDIPAGVQTGDVIKHTGLGDNSIQGTPGDLFVRIFVQDHEIFKRFRQNLEANIDVNVLDAIIGCSILVKGIDGNKFKVNIPPGTAHDSQLRLPNQGMPLINSDVKGDLILKVKLNVPTDLSEDQLEIIKNLRNSS